LSQLSVDTFFECKGNDKIKILIDGQRVENYRFPVGILILLSYSQRYTEVWNSFICKLCRWQSAECNWTDHFKLSSQAQPYELWFVSQFI